MGVLQCWITFPTVPVHQRRMVFEADRHKIKEPSYGDEQPGGTVLEIAVNSRAFAYETDYRVRGSHGFVGSIEFGTIGFLSSMVSTRPTC